MAYERLSKRKYDRKVRKEKAAAAAAAVLHKKGVQQLNNGQHKTKEQQIRSGELRLIKMLQQQNKRNSDQGENENYPQIQEKAVVRIQSGIRGHLVRTKAMNQKLIVINETNKLCNEEHQDHNILSRTKTTVDHEKQYCVAKHDQLDEYRKKRAEFKEAQLKVHMSKIILLLDWCLYGLLYTFYVEFFFTFQIKSMFLLTE